MDVDTTVLYCREPAAGNTQLVMFDIDGTLIDSGEFDASLYKEAIQEVLDIVIGDDWSSYRNVTDGGTGIQILCDRK